MISTISQIRQNPTHISFKRKFAPQELDNLVRGNVNTAISIGFEIGAGKIRAQDGALSQLERCINHRGSVSAFVHEAKAQLLKIAQGAPKEPERAIPTILPHEVRGLRFPSENPELVMATAVKAGQGVIKADEALPFIDFFKTNFVTSPAIEHFEKLLKGS